MSGLSWLGFRETPVQKIVRRQLTYGWNYFVNVGLNAAVAHMSNAQAADTLPGSCGDTDGSGCSSPRHDSTDCRCFLIARYRSAVQRATR